MWSFARGRLGNAEAVARVLTDFGFPLGDAPASLFLEPGRIVRMGVPPLRIEVITGISGVEFDECYASRVTTDIDGVYVDMMGLADLKTNKRASGRHKDLSDLEHLP